MNIVVCVKMVPDTAHLKFDSAGGLLLEGTENIMNPFCEYAVETAVRLKEASEGGKLTALSIGSLQTREVLKRALAMGCDEAYLISDPSFEGSDALVMANILAETIKKFIPDYDLVLAGQSATDGMGGITGPALAQLLEIPSITFSKKIEFKESKTITVERETENGEEFWEVALPGVVSMMKCDYAPRIPSIKGVMKANRTEIPVIDRVKLGLSEDQVGLSAAFTQVERTWRKAKKSGGIKIDGSADPQAAVKELVGFLKEQKII